MKMQNPKQNKIDNNLTVKGHMLQLRKLCFYHTILYD